MSLGWESVEPAQDCGKARGKKQGAIQNVEKRMRRAQIRRREEGRKMSSGDETGGPSRMGRNDAGGVRLENRQNLAILLHGDMGKVQHKRLHI